jgi:hypothetical protein
MNVAVPLAKHSWMFGQVASSQTVTSWLARKRDFSVSTALPEGSLTRIQGGFRRFGASASKTAVFRASLSAPSCPAANDDSSIRMGIFCSVGKPDS